MLSCIGNGVFLPTQPHRPTFEYSLELRPDARAKLLFQTLPGGVLRWRVGDCGFDAGIRRCQTRVWIGFAPLVHL